MSSRATNLLFVSSSAILSVTWTGVIELWTWFGLVHYYMLNISQNFLMIHKFPEWEFCSFLSSCRYEMRIFWVSYLSEGSNFRVGVCFENHVNWLLSHTTLRAITVLNWWLSMMQNMDSKLMKKTDTSHCCASRFQLWPNRQCDVRLWGMVKIYPTLEDRFSYLRIL